MQRILFSCIIQQLLFCTLHVESLGGDRVTRLLNADNREFSFVASLQDFYGQHFCSGSLITVRHVITAAHCLEKEHPGDVWVVLGVADLRTLHVGCPADSWITYKDWATKQGLQVSRYFNDLAIITLWGGIDQPNLRPIRLTDLNKKQAQGKTATIFGWQASKTILAKASVNTLSDDDCRDKMRVITNLNKTLNERVLCTFAKPHVLLQAGDSGGPLLDEFGALIGVHISIGPRSALSWGHFSDEFLYPYRVNLHSSISCSKFRQFIINYTGYH